MTSLKKATEYRDLALEVGKQEAADAHNVEVGTITRAIQQVDKALRDGGQHHIAHRHENKTFPAERGNMTATEASSPRHTKGWVPDFAKKEGERAGKLLSPKGSRVLIIGDLHEPFCLDSYFDHCCKVYEQYECDRVVFIGDVIDNHYSSYHEADPDGMCAGREMDLAVEKLGKWYRKFPDADIICGNHDRIVARKVHSAGVTNRWIRGYADALETPSWEFHDRVVIDNVQYIHGEGGTARTKSRKDMMSTVQGHLHTQAYTEWTVGAAYKIFGCQVGCGIDHESYAMSYAKNFGKPAIGCAVVLYGKTCINELADLGGVE